MVQETFETYCKGSGYTNQQMLAEALDKWGTNQFHVPLPQFLAMLQVCSWTCCSSFKLGMLQKSCPVVHFVGPAAQQKQA